MENILVTGATGQLGKEVIEHLVQLQGDFKVQALARSADKAKDMAAKGVEVRMGDYNDKASLEAAFIGVDKLYFVSGSDIMERSAQHRNVVDAAKAAGVKHIFYTSFVRKNESDTSPIAFLASAHMQTEAWLKESGITYTILMHTIYVDVLPMFLGDQVVATGVAFFPAGDGKISFMARKDMAELGAKLLVGTGHENKVYQVCNNQAVTMTEVAAMISEITGKSIQYISPDIHTYKKALTDAGVPQWLIGMSVGFGLAFAQGEFNTTDGFAATVLGRKPQSVKEYLTQFYSS